jgi:hypothetical protein
MEEGGPFLLKSTAIQTRTLQHFSPFQPFHSKAKSEKRILAVELFHAPFNTLWGCF